MPLILNGTDGVQGNSGAFIAETAKSATGTSVDFTGIPSWVKRVTVLFAGVSTNGTSQVQVQLGDSGGVETTGYIATTGIIITTTPSTGDITSGFPLGGVVAGNIRSGIMTITALGSNVWVCSAVIKGGPGTAAYIAGDKTLSDTLTQIRVTTVNGTDTFDAGTINILYE
jgi:hypothetical protein